MNANVFALQLLDYWGAHKRLLNRNNVFISTEGRLKKARKRWKMPGPGPVEYVHAENTFHAGSNGTANSFLRLNDAVVSTSIVVLLRSHLVSLHRLQQ